jgi:multicomponent K+:H+ antiporter subunit G
MMETHLPLWAGIPATVLLVVGGVLAFTGSWGLLRLKDFYSRIHAPTLGSTLGSSCVLGASMLVFSAIEGRPVIHEVVITLFLVLTLPVGAMLLVQAASYRDKQRTKAGRKTSPNR